MRDRNQIKPPRWADWFLRFYCRPEYLEEIQGDVYELFEVRQSESRSRARRLFVWDVLRFFRWSNIKLSNTQQFNQLTMVTNNFKIARRSLWRNKFYTGINLIGISLGIACFLLSYLYVSHEFSYDKFHTNADDIYRVWIHQFEDGEEYFEGVVPIVMGTPLRNDFPEIAHVIQVRDVGAYYTSVEDQLYMSKQLSIVDEGFLNAFDFKLLLGDKETALSKKEHVVLTEADAMERLGSIDVLGQTVDYELRGKKYQFIVAGIIENPPVNSSLKYGSLINIENNERGIYPQSLTSWWNFSGEMYVQLEPNTNVAALEAKFPQMVQTGQGEGFKEGDFTVKLQPLADIYFDELIDGENASGDLQTVRILGIVGLVILVLAGINFINLSVGQSMKRAREVGVRKVMGAFRKQLIFQFLGESLLLTFMAMLLGLVVSNLLLPVFNDFANTQLQLQFGWSLISALLLAVLIIGILSGIYPALILSSFKPAVVLKSGKGNFKGRSGMANVLITIQFLTAIFFVSATIIMTNQVEFLSSKDLGFQKEAKVYLTLPRAKTDVPGTVSVMKANALEASQFMTELSKITAIKDLTQGNNYFGDRGWMKLTYHDADKEQNEFVFNHVGENFIEFFGIEMAQGKSFADATDREKTTGVIVNEAFLKRYAMEEPLGAKIYDQGFGEHSIIGVTKDFHFASLREEVAPLVMVVDPTAVFEAVYGISSSQNTLATVIADVQLDQIEKVRKEMKAVWEDRYNQPFELGFIDTRLEKLYEQERRTSALVLLITGLAIVIASLGLLGLAALTIKNRFKEIGIRKVLGATSMSIFRLLYKIFMSPVMVAFIISVPLTVLVMQEWLGNFAYQISIGPWHFLASGATILLITLLAVSYQSVCVSRANPVDTIRYE